MPKTGCLHTFCTRTAVYSRAEVVSTAGRGAEFFGLRHPIVQHLVQASAGPRRCPSDYRWRKFQVNQFYAFLTIDDIILETS